MMNIVGLFLVVTSLVAAGLWSPNDPKTVEKGSLDHDRGVIVKEGHRVVVVEYDKEDQPVLKVSFSPEADLFPRRTGSDSDDHSFMDQLKEDAKSDLTKLGHGLSAPFEEGEHPEDQPHHRRTPKELICDAYGKCKHKIADAIGRTKDTVSETAHEAAEKVKDTTHRVEEAAEKAAEKVEDTKHRVSEGLYEAAEKAKDSSKHYVEEVAEKAKDTKHRVEEAAERAAEKAKDTKHSVSEGLYEAAEKTKRTAQRAEEAAFESVGEAYERPKKSLRQKAHDLKERKKEMGRNLEHVVEDHVREAAKEVRDLGKTIGIDVAKNVTGWLRVAGDAVAAKMKITAAKMNPVTGVVHLMGFSTAYGTGVWVTFVMSHVLAHVLPRQQFSVVQSKVYPAYFRTMAVAITAAIFGYVVSHGGKLRNGLPEVWELGNLFASLGLVLVNMIYLEPRATKVMFEKMKHEKEEGRGRGEETTEKQPTSEAPAKTVGAEAGPPPEPERAARNRANLLERRLKKLNTLSSCINILCLMALSWHVYFLGNRLHLSYNKY